jgi:hypothetical protein
MLAARKSKKGEISSFGSMNSPNGHPYCKRKEMTAGMQE